MYVFFFFVLLLLLFFRSRMGNNVVLAPPRTKREREREILMCVFLACVFESKIVAQYRAARELQPLVIMAERGAWRGVCDVCACHHTHTSHTRNTTHPPRQMARFRARHTPPHTAHTHTHTRSRMCGVIRTDGQQRYGALFSLGEGLGPPRPFVVVVERER